MPTSIALSPHFEAFVKAQIKSGRYNNVSEVVRAGLRMLEDAESQQDLILKKLKNDIALGKTQGDVRAANDVFKRLQRKYKDQSKQRGT